jgi:hypothetical protein
MPNPSWYVGPGDYLNVAVNIDTLGVRLLTANLLQVSGAFPNLPGDIFLYLNTGTTTLGEYQGVCSIDEMARTQVFNPSVAIPIFGNKFVRYNTAKIVLGLTDDYNLTVTRLKTSIKALSVSISTKKNITQIAYIP